MEAAETMKNGEELMTKLESDSVTLMNAIIVDSQQLSGLIMNGLECSICKELLIEVENKILNKFKVRSLFINCCIYIILLFL